MAASTTIVGKAVGRPVSATFRKKTFYVYNQQSEDNLRLGGGGMCLYLAGIIATSKGRDWAHVCHEGGENRVCIKQEGRLCP
jgi:hypothetical protein